MADSLEYVFTCQVCFEDFKGTGSHVPRLLPCTHTLCETCVGQLIRGDMLECPECRQKHPATRKEKSFPQNKYILVNIKRSSHTSKKPEVDLCERHNRPRDLFCTEELCQQRICPLCLKDDHQNHNFEDAEQLLKDQSLKFVEHVKSLRCNLLSNKEKMLSAKEDAKKTTTECWMKIEAARVKQIKTLTELFDQMIAKVENNLADYSSKVDNKTREIDNNLSLLADIENNNKTVTSVEDMTEIITTLRVMAENLELSQVGTFKDFQYREHQPFPLNDLQKIVGSLDSRDVPVDIDVEPLMKILPLKSIQDASELQLEGKEQLRIFETNLASELGNNYTIYFQFHKCGMDKINLELFSGNSDYGQY